VKASASHRESQGGSPKIQLLNGGVADTKHERRKRPAHKPKAPVFDPSLDLKKKMLKQQQAQNVVTPFVVKNL
jgi:hypothetical protein